MTKKTYNKTPISFEEQLNVLEQRKLVVENKEEAIHFLQAISYYRLSAYFLPYQKVKDNFNEQVTFRQIIDTYLFDKELRLLVFDCIEQIEIAIRTQIVYSMSMQYNNSHWQDEKALFVKPYYNAVGILIDPFSDFQSVISKAKSSRRTEVFIKHYTSNYDTPTNPPSWMCLELLTMGELSNLYKGLQQNADKKRIADFFDLHPTVFTSWLHTLTYVRNLCAHHSRLWNRDLAIEPDRLLKPVGNWISQPFQNNKRVFYFLCTLKYMLDRVQPKNNLKEKLKLLFQNYNQIPIQYLGIPSDGKGNLLEWENENIWK
jgi:abortive infection bacteriophage resistance protein